MKTFLFYLLSFTWGLPMTLVGCAVAAVLRVAGHRPKRWGLCWYFEIGEKWGGLELGVFFLVQKKSSRHTRCHELGHALQNCVFGPLMCAAFFSDLSGEEFRPTRIFGSTNITATSRWARSDRGIAMRKEIKKCCMICGDIFISTTTSSAHLCPSCAELRRKYRGYTAEQRRRKKLRGNQAVIERVNGEAAAQGLTYGKLEGKRYAEKHVRVKIPTAIKEGER